MIKSLLVIICFVWSLPALAEQPIKKEIRDQSGKLLFKTHTRGNKTETRDPSGKLINKSKTTNGTTEVRAPNGKLLYKVK